MNFEEWLAEVPLSITRDALWQMRVYQVSLFLGDLAWYDSRKLIQDRSLIALADQLYRAAGGISTNIGEGYSRASGKDQARFYEYALGSARESRDWYFKGRHALGLIVTNHRLDLLENIIRQLLVMIPDHRGKYIKEEHVNYEAYPLGELFQNVPMPSS
jgi:four helix bundle protein